MKKSAIYLTLTTLMLTGCSSSNLFSISGAEVTGLAFMHDRRSSKTMMKDESIENKAAIKLALSDLPYSHFNVTSYNGMVLLTGEVPNQQSRKVAAEIVSLVSEVKLVHNELVVTIPSSFSTRTQDTGITIDVKGALTDIQDIPGFDATRVKVVTESGTVFLMGLVRETESVKITNVIRHVPKVKKIVKVFEYIS